MGGAPGSAAARGAADTLIEPADWTCARAGAAAVPTPKSARRRARFTQRRSDPTTPPAYELSIICSYGHASRVDGAALEAEGAGAHVDFAQKPSGS